MILLLRCYNKKALVCCTNDEYKKASKNDFFETSDTTNKNVLSVIYAVHLLLFQRASSFPGNNRMAPSPLWIYFCVIVSFVTDAD